MSEKSGQDLLNIYQKFSKKLDDATKEAASVAFHHVFPDLGQFSERDKVPVRPILLGGDDITIIIKADKALEFTSVFMKEFESQTKKHFKAISWDPLKEGLTIKAGIAYVKPSYPFHFAVSLAEDLCKKAKDEAQRFSVEGRIPSCLMFHQVQSSFIGSYKDMVERELTFGQYHLDYGPYFLEPQEGFASISNLEAWYERFQKEDAPAAQLRSLLTEYADGKVERAQQYEARIRSIRNYRDILNEVEMKDSIFKSRNNKNVSPVMDIIKMGDLHKQKKDT